MLRLASPFYLFLFIPLIASIWFIYRKRRTGLLCFPSVANIPMQAFSLRILMARTASPLILLAMSMLILALARPQTVGSKVKRTTDSISIFMIVDVSGSMEALDLDDGTNINGTRKTRLDVVKETFDEFITRRPDDLIGLITFGGFTSTRAPLTQDQNSRIRER